MCARTLSASLFAERAKLPSKEWVALPECQSTPPREKRVQNETRTRDPGDRTTSDRAGNRPFSLPSTLPVSPRVLGIFVTETPFLALAGGKAEPRVSRRKDPGLRVNSLPAPNKVGELKRPPQRVPALGRCGRMQARVRSRKERPLLLSPSTSLVSTPLSSRVSLVRPTSMRARKAESSRKKSLAALALVSLD